MSLYKVLVPIHLEVQSLRVQSSKVLCRYKSISRVLLYRCKIDVLHIYVPYIDKDN